MLKDAECPHISAGGLRLAVTRSFDREGPRNAGLTVSSLLHLGLLLCISLLLGPLHQGGDGPVEVTLAVAPDEPRLELTELNLSELGFTEQEPVLIEFEQSAPAPIVNPALRPLRSASSRNGTGTAAGFGPRGTFFGTVAQGNRFVYVVDISGSMNDLRDPANRSTRLDSAIEELRASIERLAPDQSFYVVLFSEETHLMFDEQSLLPQMMPATPENKQRLFDWLSIASAGGGTDPRLAIHFALGMNPSAVFLLSDGRFNGSKNRNNAGILHGNPSVQEVVSYISDEQTPIHTIAYEDASGAERMKSLASQTGGEYRFIEPLVRSRQRGLSTADKKVELQRKRTARLANNLFQKAVALDKKGEYKSAEKRYRALIKRFPNSDAAGQASARLQRQSSGSVAVSDF